MDVAGPRSGVTRERTGAQELAIQPVRDVGLIGKVIDEIRPRRLDKSIPRGWVDKVDLSVGDIDEFEPLTRKVRHGKSCGSFVILRTNEDRDVCAGEIGGHLSVFATANMNVDAIELQHRAGITRSSERKHFGGGCEGPVLGRFRRVIRPGSRRSQREAIAQTIQ